MRAALVFPHQLYRPHPAIRDTGIVYLVEDPLFFSQYRFHRKKLMLHRATMKEFQLELEQSGRECRYIDAHRLERTEQIGEILEKDGVSVATYVDACDDWLGVRLARGLAQKNIASEKLIDPAFLTDDSVIDTIIAGEEKLFFHSFYIQQRKRLGVLVDSKNKPLGGQWSFDRENRKRLPKQIAIPERFRPAECQAVQEAREYVRRYFPKSYGSDAEFEYPVRRKDARKVLDDFFDKYFGSFGPYEDAISTSEGPLFHSMLTPALNVGLLTPRQILSKALDAAHDAVPLPSREGFIRQVMGWREFVRVSYRVFGRTQRTKNFWGNERKISKAFYTGQTGIAPVDTVVRKVLTTGYCHHIERLMILGGFFLLCETDPDDVYQWFMELFVDAYDWVMVPNVYGMSQFADGGLITTKPYLSGSNYILKMSDYPRDTWCDLWDALYWRFICRHREFLLSNPRMALAARNLERKTSSEMRRYNDRAENFLESL